jgi:hypothetical protein
MPGPIEDYARPWCSSSPPSFRLDADGGRTRAGPAMTASTDRSMVHSGSLVRVVATSYVQ